MLRNKRKEELEQSGLPYCVKCLNPKLSWDLREIQFNLEEPASRVYTAKKAMLCPDCFGRIYFDIFNAD